MPNFSTFEEQMQDLLQDQWQAFQQALTEEPFYALHFNSQVENCEEIKQAFDLSRPHPYDRDGYYFDRQQVRPGAHPWHESGAYYIQEPAAMSVIPLAKEIFPKVRLVIDLCAAPGGKTIQAATLAPQALIIACEIDRKRSGILYENIERLGLTNVVVLNVAPEKLLPLFAHCADVIIADVPCSGEGMFRKDDFARSDWSPQKIQTCVRFQHQLLEVATQLLAPQGYLLYSTCTYNQQENEEQIELAKEKYGLTLHYFHRFYPHQFDGEGQTAAMLQAPNNGERGQWQDNGKSRTSVKLLRPYLSFCQEIGLTAFPEDEIHLRGEHLVHLPKQFPELKNLPSPMPGVDLGILKKDRFVPAHQLAKMHPTSPQLRRLSLKVDDPRVKAYLRGESLTLTSSEEMTKGWVLVQLDGRALGWGKIVDSQLKNHYPKGLRKNLP